MGQGTNQGGAKNNPLDFFSGGGGGGAFNPGFQTAAGSGLLNQYTQGMPDIAQAYMRSFNRGGPIDVPSFQELYGSYRNVAERETGRQAAALNETMGSQGARYGSDIMGAQSRLRENLGQDLSLQSGNLLQGLRQQQFGEASSLAGLQATLGEAGMGRMFQNYLLTSGLPPGLLAGMGYNPAQPTQVTY